MITTIVSDEVIRDKIEKLPNSLKKEAFDYIEFLLYKHIKTKHKTGFQFNWEGGLSEFKNENTSVELQHKASEWR